MENNGSCIVLVEDDEDDIFLIEAALEELRVKNEMKVFRNGQEALTYLLDADTRPAVVISDLNMPVLNGLELLDSLREAGFFYGGQPQFVFLSTSELSNIPNFNTQKNDYAFFTKGYSYSQTLETISKILERI